MSRHFLMVLLFWMTAGDLYSETVIEFTEEQGYTRGALVTHPDWFGKGAGIKVDPTGEGSVVVDNKSTFFASCYFRKGFSSSKFSISVDFFITQGAQPDKRRNMLRIGLCGNFPDYNTQPHLFFGMNRLNILKGGHPGYSLSIYSPSIVGGQNSVHANVSDTTLLGLSATDVQSDRLRLEFQASYLTENRWFYTLTLINPASGYSQSLSGEKTMDSKWTHAENYLLLLQTGAIQKLPGTSIKITSIKITPENSRPEEVSYAFLAP